jgi:hypothetical protein
VRARIQPFNPAPEDSPIDVSEAVDAASTRAFHLTAIASAALCIAGAAINGIGIRNEELHDHGEAEPATTG